MRSFEELAAAATKAVTSYPNAGHLAGIVAELASACQALQAEVEGLRQQQPRPRASSLGELHQAPADQEAK